MVKSNRFPPLDTPSRSVGEDRFCPTSERTLGFIGSKSNNSSPLKLGLGWLCYSLCRDVILWSLEAITQLASL